ncbi:hypothetical protein NCLIV_060240 [Neospora caninum Liverpool]|uniref:Uncharacterized protein n=1 Tax=Neospora caninum (strain Liverpool) TaxID=572307 RepID=F0VPF3_NEOCL|nr:hypothetical protein NCLIV_060240 [Neospora caninum Liverpool]CBZ55599.1 hypothetical protein NCLIV_060240 [Neospora caninum Liverpool]|eukprot:XP_003885627.1 hypothetical protein NCLIV_060240 [Neospora caninum Liverpool]
MVAGFFKVVQNFDKDRKQILLETCFRGGSISCAGEIHSRVALEGLKGSSVDRTTAISLVVGMPADGDLLPMDTFATAGVLKCAAGSVSLAARWVAKRAGLKKVYFPVYKYGFDRAYELAVSTRRGLENDAAAGIRGVGPLRPRSPWEPGCPGSSGVSLEHADSAQQPSVTVPRTCTQAAVAQGKMKSGQLEDSDEGDSDGDHLSEGAQLQKTPRTSSDVAAQEVAKQGAETAFHHIESPSTSCPKHKEQGLSAPTMLSLASFAPSQIDVEAERTADAANERTRLQGGEDRPRATTSSSGEGSIYMGDSTTASTTGSEDNSTLRAATSSCLFSESGEGSASTARAFMDDEAMQQALATDSAEALAKLLSALPAGVHFDFSSKRWFAVYSPRESPEANQHDHILERAQLILGTEKQISFSLSHRAWIVNVESNRRYVPICYDGLEAAFDRAIRCRRTLRLESSYGGAGRKTAPGRESPASAPGGVPARPDEAVQRTDSVPSDSSENQPRVQASQGAIKENTRTMNRARKAQSGLLGRIDADVFGLYGSTAMYF